MTTPSTNDTWNPERVAQLRAFVGEIHLHGFHAADLAQIDFQPLAGVAGFGAPPGLDVFVESVGDRKFFQLR